MKSGNPQVSILLAVRNEAETIENCLDKLCQLQAPDGFYEILVGNDGSDDDTPKLLLPYQDKYPQLSVYHIQENQKPLPGKAGVLTILAQKARGTYFYFTDADIQVNPKWLDSYQYFEEDPDLGILCGRTLIHSSTTFQHWQALEWIFEISSLQVLASWGIPITAWGNNMAIRRAAYEQSGGYETLGFSITEDFQLFWAILKQGYAFLILEDPGSRVQSEPCPNWKSLVSQRRRWLRALKHLPVKLRGLVYLRILYLPVLVVSLWFWGQIAWILGLTFFLIHFLGLSISLMRLRVLNLLPHFFGYLLYSLILSVTLLVYEVLNRPLTWKGRVYS